jgi:hypothetical protein
MDARGECGDEQGYWFHDWKPECLKVNVLAAREKARLRKAKQRESHSESRVTDAVSPASCLVPTQPNPTQPIDSLVTSVGGVTEVDAQEPPLRCSKHLNHTDPPNCVGCRDARKANEAWHSGELDRRRAARKAAQSVIDACGLCDDRGMRDLGNAAARCNHQEAM